MTIIRTLLILLAFASQAVFAVGTPAPEVRLVAHRVVMTHDASGSHERLEPLKELRPGDMVEYQATYVNPTVQTVHNVMLTVPVPAGGLEVIAHQEAPLATSASIDGKVFAAMPLTRNEIVNGKAVMKPVPLAEYRSLRWSLGDVSAGTRREVKARMVMPALPSSTTTAATTANTASLLTAVRASGSDLNVGK